MELDVAVLGDSVWVGAVLLLAAVIGKLGGSMLGAWGALDLRTAAIVGVSMVPRAEIALFVIDQGRTRAPDLVPASLHGGVVWVVGGTCLLTPPLLRRLLAAGRPRIVADGPRFRVASTFVGVAASPRRLPVDTGTATGARMGGSWSSEFGGSSQRPEPWENKASSWPKRPTSTRQPCRTR
jgi:hypothetical protein